MKGVCPSRRPGGRARAFTLIELLVVVAILAVLAAILVPAVTRALAAGRQSFCAQNLHQIHLANTQYAGDHGRYAPAAPDLFGANLTRWHGARTERRQPFKAGSGPLAEYLGSVAAVRSCPALRGARSGPDANAFEAACGGYGYNQVGVGSTSYFDGYNGDALRQGMAPEDLASPASTVMFADTAFPQPYQSPDYLIEYSFAEPYHFLSGSAPPAATSTALPSIHFRHRTQANVVWGAGQVSARPLTVPGPGPYQAYGLGWFGDRDNNLFDPF